MRFDGAGKLCSGPETLRDLLHALDWDGRMGLSKKPVQPPHAKSLPIDRLRWNLFTDHQSTLKDVADNPVHVANAWESTEPEAVTSQTPLVKQSGKESQKPQAVSTALAACTCRSEAGCQDACRILAPTEAQTDWAC